ncbi:hypothetical protein BGZ61DRAFT_510826 [Ilyonectria robusta]|uniref:uncharacterized protein n=1 Tax=Ilyonectria robusta TaxID=1079257 RepID=UPI001E8E809A|nr:uncharacterized protein BGZ61DRAFT_510826 [Ilyonectria robusta]KAH8656333.1 hypothetical protein BGZ61DRAFT_510826 [Ilyonectria robusta]
MVRLAPHILFSATLVSSVLARAKYTFKPEKSTVYQDYDDPTGTSWWVSSYITSEEGKQYLALSHVMTPWHDLCRSSVLDLDALKYWVHLEYCERVGNKLSDSSVPLDADFDTYGFRALADDNVSKMNAWVTTNASFSFDLTWEATSKIVFNGGSGIIPFGPKPRNATEWGVPAAKTTGTLTLDGKTVAVDTKNSFSWYDRQLSYGSPQNWTWFQLNFPGTDIKASVWAYDSTEPSKDTANFVTIRRDTGNTVMGYTLTPDASNVWTSPKSGIVYPLAWKLNFENGDHLVVKSIRDDQEMYGPMTNSDSAYEGFITVTGSFLGQKRGFGLVEMVRI